LQIGLPRESEIELNQHHRKHFRRRHVREDRPLPKVVWNDLRIRHPQSETLAHPIQHFTRSREISPTEFLSSIQTLPRCALVRLNKLSEFLLPLRHQRPQKPPGLSRAPINEMSHNALLNPRRIRQ